MFFWLCLDRTWPSVWIILEFRSAKFENSATKLCVIHVSSGFRHEISNNKYANFEMGFWTSSGCLFKINPKFLALFRQSGRCWDRVDGLKGFWTAHFDTCIPSTLALEYHFCHREHPHSFKWPSTFVHARPVKLKPVHFTDRFLSSFWTVHFGPELHSLFYPDNSICFDKN